MPTSERLVRYEPRIFGLAHRVRGDRIILVEDTWITGATAMSAAGKLLEEGAQSVVIAPLAREMKPQFHGDQHPYVTYLNRPYEINSWPRSATGN